MYLLIPLGGFALGLLVARWWVVAAAPLLGVYVRAGNELERHLGEWVAFSPPPCSRFASGCGVAGRRLAHRL